MELIPSEWVEIGEITIGPDGKLHFPDPSIEPGIYRLQFTANDQQNIYLGETDNLRRRFGHYRNPGPSQLTNIRLNALIMKHLESGGTARAATITEAILNLSKCSETVPLRRRGFRLLLEEDLQSEAIKRGDNVLNIRMG